VFDEPIDLGLLPTLIAARPLKAPRESQCATRLSGLDFTKASRRAGLIRFTATSDSFSRMELQYCSVQYVHSSARGDSELRFAMLDRGPTGSRSLPPYGEHPTDLLQTNDLSERVELRSDG
jgi:hypothetical protein